MASAKSVRKKLMTTSPASVRVMKSPMRSSEMPKTDRYEARISVEPPYANRRTKRCAQSSLASREERQTETRPSSSRMRTRSRSPEGPWGELEACVGDMALFSGCTHQLTGVRVEGEGGTGCSLCILSRRRQQCSIDAFRSRRTSLYINEMTSTGTRWRGAPHAGWPPRKACPRARPEAR